MQVPLAGNIFKIHVQPGHQVSEGDVLVTVSYTPLTLPT
ncbi:biotin/lipoyl-binding protein, partial [Photobacterium aphoticum]